MDSFTPMSASLGGLLIGLASVLTLLALRRTAGISGIVGGLVAPRAGDVAWRACYVAGLITGGAGVALLSPEAHFSMRATPGFSGLLVAGLLVGFGARLGGGCTSGHGVCGIGRLSLRSTAATLTFMTTAALVVFVVRHVLSVTGTGGS